LEILRKPGPWASAELVVPAERTIDRILHRQGLLRARPRKRPKDSYRRWERPAPMQLWQMDIVEGVRLVNPATGVMREAKLVTAVDDHSRFCVIAKVVERATGRAVCLALAEALARFGVPEEIITTQRQAVHGPVRPVSAAQGLGATPRYWTGRPPDGSSSNRSSATTSTWAAPTTSASSSTGASSAKAHARLRGFECKGAPEADTPAGDDGDGVAQFWHGRVLHRSLLGVKTLTARRMTASKARSGSSQRRKIVGADPKPTR
jgi:Integrase core domain